MINFILFVFFVLVLYAGFWLGAKYHTLENAWMMFKVWLKDTI